MKTTIIGVLIATSLVSLFLIVERGIALRREAVIPGRLVEAQSVCQTQEELLALRTTSNQLPSPYGRLLSCAIDHLHLPREENIELIQTRARAEVAKLERGIVVLEIVTGVAPFLVWWAPYLGSSRSSKEWAWRLPASKPPSSLKASL